MSRVYWHTPSGEAALAGAERLWCSHLVENVAAPVWGFSERGRTGLARALWLLEHAVDRLGSGIADLKRQASVIREQLSHTKAQGWTSQDIERERDLIRWMGPVMRVNGIDLRVHGVALNTVNIDSNTALYAGSAPVALASKIHGWCECHAWIEGADREGVAKIIEEGLELRLYRRGMGWESRYSEFDEGNGVIDLLRADADEPVVLSYSVCDSFPNPDCTTWEADDSDGRLAAIENDDHRAEARAEHWSELSSDEQWDGGMWWLRRERPWARINPANLRDFSFDAPVSAYDFLGEDIDKHLAELLKDHPDFTPPTGD
jgi:hypothetical protein